MATYEKGSKESLAQSENQKKYNAVLAKYKFPAKDCPAVTAASLFHSARREFLLDLEFAMGRHKGGVAR